ncbi:iron-containing alcohol dehydrogenase [Rhodovibrionaceae bacterium A322]
MDLLAPQDWTFPVPIAYGPGRLKEIADLAKSAGLRRPLIVTDRGSRDLPFLTSLGRYLSDGGLSWDFFAEISPNPRDSEIAGGRSHFLQGGHDGVIAVGGGSGMDGGKAICLVARNEIALADFNYDKPAPDMTGQLAFPPLITVPTTAGTGAETESTAMITDTARGMKYCAWHAELKPSVTLLDPEITLGLPPHLTAWTGVDALVHAVEAYCVPDFHPLCDGAALEGLRLIAAWLPTAVREPENLEARGAMLVGSCLAGVAFLKGLGLVHAISHMVGAEYDSHHGLTNAVALPAVLQFNAPDIADKLPALSQAMGLPDASFGGFYTAVCQLLDELEIPKTLQDIGVPPEAAAALAAKAIQDAAAGTNPRPVSLEEAEEVIRVALLTGR